MRKIFLVLFLVTGLLAPSTALAQDVKITPDERKKFAIRFDRDDLTRADLTARATAINSLRASKVLSANEGRAWLGLAPYAGGDTYENPNTGTAPAKTPVDKEGV